MNKKGIFYLSNSSLNLYLICPLLYKNKYVIEQESSILKFGSWIHKIIELYTKSEQKKDIFQIAKSTFTKYNINLDDFLTGKTILENFLKREYLNYKVLGFEQKFENILPNGVALKGIIDRIIERDKNTIEIIDYKSGFKFYNIIMINKNTQLKIYKNLILNDDRYKKYSNIILTIDPLRYEPISVIQDEIDNNLFLDWIEEIYLKITSDKKFEPNFPNSFCKNCYIKNICPKYKELLKYDFRLRKKDKEKAIHFYELQKIKLIIDKDLEFYKDYFKNLINQQNKNEIKIDKIYLTLKNNRLFCKK